MSKSLYFYSEMREMVASCSKSNGLVGHIPHQWVKQIPFDSRRTKIKQFHENMGYFVNKILPYTKGTSLSSFILTHIMRRAKVIPKNSSVKIKYVGGGSFGKGYLLSNETTGDKFFLKRFRSSYESLEIVRHGILTETNNKMYMKSKFKRKDKEYFSNFHYADVKNGYYIEDYLPEAGDIAKNAQTRDERNALYQRVVKEKGLFAKVKSILKKYNLYHDDLSIYNIKIYDTEKGYKPKCFDVGGLDYASPWQ